MARSGCMQGPSWNQPLLSYDLWASGQLNKYSMQWHSMLALLAALKHDDSCLHVRAVQYMHRPTWSTYYTPPYVFLHGDLDAQKKPQPHVLHAPQRPANHGKSFSKLITTLRIINCTTRYAPERPRPAEGTKTKDTTTSTEEETNDNRGTKHQPPNILVRLATEKTASREA